MRVRLGLVTETSPAFLNQVKLLLYSFRKNAGALSGTPVTLMTNSEPLDPTEVSFFEKYFSPIEFKTCPRLGAIPHTSKLNVFYGIEPSSYDVLLYMDCDTVVRKTLERLLDPVADGAQFVCRRGGKTDRDRFTDFDRLVHEYCGECEGSRIGFEGKSEWPMFNSGVFLATSEAVQRIRRDAVEITYSLYNRWQRIDAVERLGFTKLLFKLKPFRHRKIALADWPLEQGALALACIKAGVVVKYLDEVYNSWGNLDFHVLHCFKSAYRFDRAQMYNEDPGNWLKEYAASDLPGKVFLSHIVGELRQDLGL